MPSHTWAAHKALCERVRACVSDKLQLLSQTSNCTHTLTHTDTHWQKDFVSADSATHGSSPPATPPCPLIGCLLEEGRGRRCPHQGDFAPCCCPRRSSFATSCRPGPLVGVQPAACLSVCLSFYLPACLPTCLPAGRLLIETHPAVCCSFSSPRPFIPQSSLFKLLTVLEIEPTTRHHMYEVQSPRGV